MKINTQTQPKSISINISTDPGSTAYTILGATDPEAEREYECGAVLF